MVETSTSRAWRQDASEHAGLMIAVGIGLMILGFLAIVTPFVASYLTTLAVGWVLIGAGVVRAVLSFRADSLGAGILSFVLGAVSVFAGFIVLANPAVGLLTLTVLLAGYFFVHGIFEIVGALKLRPAAGWAWVFSSGVLSVILGFMIYARWPVSALWLVGVLVGVQLLFGGAAMTGLGMAGREAGKVQPQAPAV